MVLFVVIYTLAEKMTYITQDAILSDIERNTVIVFCSKRDIIMDIALIMIRIILKTIIYAMIR